MFIRFVVFLLKMLFVSKKFVCFVVMIEMFSLAFCIADVQDGSSFQ